MEDPFGDPFGDGEASVKPTPTTTATAAAKKKPTAHTAPVAPAKPAASKPPAIVDPFADDSDDIFASPSSSSSAAASASTAAVAKPAAAPPTAAPAAAPAVPVTSPAASASSPTQLDDPFDDGFGLTDADQPTSNGNGKHKEADTSKPAPPAPAPVAPVQPPATTETSSSDSIFPDETLDDTTISAHTPTDSESTAPSDNFGTSPSAADLASSSSASASIDSAAAATAPASVASLASTLADVYISDDEEEPEDELNLEGQSLESVPAETVAAKGSAAGIRRLDLTSNKLRSLSSLAWNGSATPWPVLEELIVDKNELSGLDGLPSLPKLSTLWLNNNRIEDLEGVLSTLEKQCPNLTYLSMLRNPATPEAYFGESGSEMEAYGRYRLYVIWRLKKLNLQFLDATPVTPEEKKEAMLRGAYCRVAKPSSNSSKSSKSSSNGNSKSDALADLDDAPSPSQRQSQVGVDKNFHSKPPKVATFLAKGKPRYDGTNSEGNRFIMNDDL